MVGPDRGGTGSVEWVALTVSGGGTGDATVLASSGSGTEVCRVTLGGAATSAIHCAALDRAFVGLADGGVGVVCASSGRLLATFKGPVANDAPKALALSPDGLRLAVAAKSGAVWVLDCRTAHDAVVGAALAALKDEPLRDRAIARVRADGGLTPGQRAQAEHLLRIRGNDDQGLVDYAWRLMRQSEVDPAELDLVRDQHFLAAHGGEPGNEGCSLSACIAWRLGRYEEALRLMGDDEESVVRSASEGDERRMAAITVLTLDSLGKLDQGAVAAAGFLPDFYGAERSEPQKKGSDEEAQWVDGLVARCVESTYGGATPARAWEELRPMLEKRMSSDAMVRALLDRTDLAPALRRTAIGLAAGGRAASVRLNNAAWVSVARSVEPTPGAFAEELKHAELAVALVPGEPDSMNTLGMALCRVGRYEEALAELRRACEVQQEMAGTKEPTEDFRLCLAIVLAHLGRADEAGALIEPLRGVSERTVDQAALLGEAESLLK